MPAFSFTAPHVSPEQERAERESLSDETRQQIHDDMYGVDQEKDIEKNSQISEEALEGLFQAIERIPMRQKKEYLEAMDRAPQLVQTESEPRMFLLCEKSNCEAAAHRLVHYWKIRRKLFGENRAYLPMTLSGAIADDKELFESGFVAIHQKDENGRTVLFIDRIRVVPPSATRDPALRCLFFLIHVLVFDHDLSMQTKGCVALVSIKGYDLYKHFDRLMSKHLAILLLHCMPMKVKALHLLAGGADGVMSLVLPSMKQVMGKECRLRMVVHSGTNDKMLESLESYGLTRRNLSEALGGDFTYNDFVTWLEGWRENQEGKDSISSTQPEYFSDTE